MDPQLLQAGQPGKSLLHVVHECSFCDFEGELIRVEVGVGKGVGDDSDDVGVLDLATGEIDADAKRPERTVVTVPAGGGTARLGEHPPAEGNDQSALFRDRYERVRW